MRVVRADTFWSRARGLGGRSDMPTDEALLIPRCRSVHTFTMRLALDLIWLDGDDRVVRIDRCVPPRRVKICLRARSVLEQKSAPPVGIAAGTEPEAERLDDRVRLALEQTRDDQARGRAR